MNARNIIIAAALAGALGVLTACGGGHASNAANDAAAQTQTMGNGASSMGNSMSGAMSSARMPNCGAVRPVWVNLRTKVYHEPGDPYYGKTSSGEYLCPSQAKAQGFRPAR